MNLDLVQLAQQLAIRYHHGQENKHDGEPYLLHVHRVAVSVERDSRLSPYHVAIAWLHDTLEDTALSYGDLANALTGYDQKERVLLAVDALTKRKGEPNITYYERLLNFPDAHEVKLHDLFDNFGRTHMVADLETAARLSQKYSLGIDILKRVK